MKILPLIPREQAAFKAQLEAQDAAWCDKLLSLYPTIVDAMEADQIKAFAGKMSTLLTFFALSAGRHDANTSSLIEHIMLDLLPLQSTQLIMHAEGEYLNT